MPNIGCGVMILNGWKEIAQYFGRGVRTVQRWEDFGLPILRPAGRLRSPIVAKSDELDAWLKQNGNGRAGDAAHDFITRARKTRSENRQLMSELARHIDVQRLIVARLCDKQKRATRSLLSAAVCFPLHSRPATARHNTKALAVFDTL